MCLPIIYVCEFTTSSDSLRRPLGKKQDDGVDAGPRGMMNGFGAGDVTGADLSDHINSRLYLLWGC